MTTLNISLEKNKSGLLAARLVLGYTLMKSPEQSCTAIGLTVPFQEMIRFP